jgi:hypothetical protein
MNSAPSSTEEQVAELQRRVRIDMIARLGLRDSTAARTSPYRSPPRRHRSARRGDRSINTVELSSFGKTKLVSINLAILLCKCHRSVNL